MCVMHTHSYGYTYKTEVLRTKCFIMRTAACVGIAASIKARKQTHKFPMPGVVDERGIARSLHIKMPHTHVVLSK